MYNCKSVIILNEIISLCRTQQELNTVNMLINHSFLLYWRPRNLIREFCIYLQESWKPHLPNSLTMGSKDTSSQEQQREAKWKRQRRKLCFCARCKGLHVRRKYIKHIHMIKWGPSIASDVSYSWIFALNELIGYWIVHGMVRYRCFSMSWVIAGFLTRCTYNPWHSDIGLRGCSTNKFHMWGALI